jgi:hypothetical protein
MATALLLRSPIAVVMLWGPEGVMIYNDAYSKFGGARHPGLLGRNVLEAWPEVADFNAHVLKEVLHGGRTLSYKDRELWLNRDGSPGNCGPISTTRPSLMNSANRLPYLPSLPKPPCVNPRRWKQLAS